MITYGGIPCTDHVPYIVYQVVNKMWSPWHCLYDVIENPEFPWPPISSDISATKNPIQTRITLNFFKIHN